MTSRRRVEHAVPNYAEAAAELSSSTARDLDKLDQAQEMDTRYMAFRNVLGPSADASDDPVHGPLIGTGRNRSRGLLLGGDSARSRRQARMYAWSPSTTSERCSRGCRAAARCWCAIV